MTAGSEPAVLLDLDPAITVLSGTDVADVTKRFEVFEALHHTMRICNPMSSAELDEVVESIGLIEGHRVLDVACGYGETLVRAAERCSIHGTGIDLSPWMIVEAHRSAVERLPAADLTWVLGEARDFTIDPLPDVAICIGAEWVWHDFAGTARALSRRLGGGGVAVVGAARLHLDADPASVATQRGRIETVDDMAASLERHGLAPLHRVDPDDDGWDRYLARTATAAKAWNERHPGERAERWVAEQADWHAARERDRDVIGWSVWIAQKAARSE